MSLPTGKNYDSSFCGNLPIHLINMIQPHGALLVLQGPELNVMQVSNNIDAIAGIEVEAIINKSFLSFIRPEEGERLQQLVAQELQGKLPVNLTFTYNGRSAAHLALVHVKDGYLLAELDGARDESADSTFVGVYQELKLVMTAIEQAADIQAVCELAVQQLKQYSGFDRVMVYQFDEEWNGTVIAEALESGMVPYLGLRFPASDVPKRARDLYQYNPYRLIPNREYSPVKLFPVVNPVTHAFLDLSDCSLRAVAGVHLEYLKNMEVMASMSTRIVKDGVLWGLISCHHRAPRYLSYEQCSVFELLSGVIGTQLSLLESRASVGFQTARQELLSQAKEKLLQQSAPGAGLATAADPIMQLLDLSGLALVRGQEVISFGATPAPALVRDLTAWLQHRLTDGLYHTQALVREWDHPQWPAALASGVVALEVHREELLLGFRPEVVEEVAWGGNPEEAIRFEANGRHYHPRHSFAVWQETVRNTAKTWEPQVLSLARQLRNFLVDQTPKKGYI